MEILNYVLYNILPTFYVLLLSFMYRVGGPDIEDSSMMQEEGQKIDQNVTGNTGVEMQESVEEREEEYGVSYEKDTDKSL